MRSSALKRYNFKDSSKTNLRSLLLDNGEQSLGHFIKEGVGEAVNIELLQTINQKDVKNLSNNIEGIVNFSKLNNVRFINKFLETVNQKLPRNGIFIGCLETKDQYKERVLTKHTAFISKPQYYGRFLIHRVGPKLKITKKTYFSITKGGNRIISLAEMLGRLVSCGFKILDYTCINGRYYFAAKKTGDPLFDMNPTYGALVTLNRYGLNGRMIKVYKLRTMHPYAEYLQKYVYSMNSLQNGGKFKEDFRVTNWAKLLRKCWIDELPMFINFFKRELKLVGVRPLSVQYFNLYPEEFRKRRLKYKPGLVPPFYNDLPETLDEIIESEKKYLDAYDKHPFLTDIRYFFSVFYNIIFKKARSK